MRRPRIGDYFRLPGFPCSVSVGASTYPGEALVILDTEEKIALALSIHTTHDAHKQHALVVALADKCGVDVPEWYRWKHVPPVSYAEELTLP